MLYREPKLLKVIEMMSVSSGNTDVSVLYREPKLLKAQSAQLAHASAAVSVLYREPKLLKDARIR